MRSARIAAAVMAATAIAFTATPATTSEAAVRPAPPGIPYPGHLVPRGLSLRPHLASRADFEMVCAWGRGGTDITTERVDFTFTVGGSPVMQSVDGLQFVAVKAKSGPPSCAPTFYRVRPTWSRD